MCGFQGVRGTIDMIFTARQLQEKCREQQRELYAGFVDLTKAFDSLDRAALWEVLLQIGYPREFVSIICSFHDDMRAAVVENGDMYPDFDVTNDTKHGGLRPGANFVHYLLCYDAKSGISGLHGRCSHSVPHIDDVFDLRRHACRQRLKYNWLYSVRNLLFADDVHYIVAHTPADLQLLFERFHTTAKRFGLTVSLKKTEAMCQSYPPVQSASVTITAGDDIALKSVDKFC